jgi:hypothetical protein
MERKRNMTQIRKKWQERMKKCLKNIYSKF